MALQPFLIEEQGSAITFRAKAVQSLAEFREDWQSRVGGQNLAEIQSPIGLLIADIADILGFTEAERYLVLGQTLSRQVENFLDQEIQISQ